MSFINRSTCDVSGISRKGNYFLRFSLPPCPGWFIGFFGMGMITVCRCCGGSIRKEDAAYDRHVCKSCEAFIDDTLPAIDDTLPAEEPLPPSEVAQPQPAPV